MSLIAILTLYTYHLILYHRTALAIMLRITYGYTLNEGADSDPMTAPFEKALATLDALKPGAWLVDVLPFLRHFPSLVPGMGFKRTAAEMRKSLHDMADIPYDFTKQEMVHEFLNVQYFAFTDRTDFVFLVYHRIMVPNFRRTSWKTT